MFAQTDHAASGYQAEAFPFLSSLVPDICYTAVLLPLFRLLARFASHSHLSGLTPHALSSLFAPLLFDIPSSSPAMSAHSAFVRAAAATEHLILAFIRSSGRSTTKGGLGVGDLPARLKEWVRGYPAMVASDNDLARAGPRRGARVIRCERASRQVRAYSRDLVCQAELWAEDLPAKWEAWERVILKGRQGSAARPKFSTDYRRKMGVKEMLPLPASVNELGRQTSYGRAARPGTVKGKLDRRSLNDEGDEARWGSLAGKEWSLFEESGFDAPLLATQGRRDGDIKSKLQFDLSESAKTVSSALLIETGHQLTSRAFGREGTPWTGPNLHPLREDSIARTSSSKSPWRSRNPSLRASRIGPKSATSCAKSCKRPRRRPRLSITIPRQRWGSR